MANGRQLKRFVKAAVTAFALVGVCAPAYAGAWTKRQYEALFISGLGFHWLEPSSEGGAPDRLKSEVSLYFEFGLTDAITVQGRGAFQEMRDLNTGDAAASQSVRTGWGGLELGGRLRLLHTGRWTSSLQIVAGIPGSGENWNNEGFGVGGGDIDARLQVGRSVGQTSFVEISAGLRARRGEASDELRIDIAAGSDLWRGSKLMVQSYSVFAIGGDAVRPAYSGHRLQASLILPLRGRYALQLSALATVTEDEMSRETAVMTSLWTRF